jgi:uncharacterized protein YndB with AHSA1/START domain
VLTCTWMAEEAIGSMDDRIEQEITIGAGLERVWDLVTRPGWWVPDEKHEQDAPDRSHGSLTVRESEKWGRYVIEVVRLEPMSYAAFRWASEFPGERPAEGNSTLVEFFVKPLGDGETSVTLVESGFTGLLGDRGAAAWQANTGGWREELASLKERSEA